MSNEQKQNIEINTSKKKSNIYGLRQIKELNSVSVSLKDRLAIYRLEEDCSLTQMIEEMSPALNTSVENIKKWLSGPGRPIPKEYIKDILKLYDLPDEPTSYERVIYKKLSTKYGNIHSATNKDKKKPNRKLSNSEKKERRNIAHDAVDQYESEQYRIAWDEVTEEGNYISLILDAFDNLPIIKKYILTTYFETYNKIPWAAWEFVKGYASLNDQGRKLIYDYMKRNSSTTTGQQATFSQEEQKNLNLFQEMTKINLYNLKEDLKRVEINSLTKSFSEKLTNLNIPVQVYLEDIELYPEIETDEWEIILYFIQLGTLYDPFDEKYFSSKQRKAFDLIDILYDDFNLGLNVDDSSSTRHFKEFQ